MRRTGLLVDFGGVLTSSAFGSFEAFCATEGLELEALGAAFRSNPQARELLVGLEEGSLAPADFETAFAPILGVAPEKLIARMCAGLQPDETMHSAVAAARQAGVRTGLLSNSWGETTYDRARWPDLFDATVVSGEEGMRKPDPRIYALAAERLGLAPEQIVFVDDLPHNLEPASELGMAVVHHTEPGETIVELERLLELPGRLRTPFEMGDATGTVVDQAGRRTNPKGIPEGISEGSGGDPAQRPRP